MTVASALRASLGPMLYLGVFGSFLAVILWNAGLQGVPASIMAVFVFVQPAVGLLLNHLFGEAPPVLFGWIGFALILGAVVMVTRRSGAPQPPTSVTHS
jgi:drug/metabolite transporter (DMT)-like permease